MKKEQSIRDIIREDLFKFQFNHYNYLEILKERGIDKDNKSYPNYSGSLYLFKVDILDWFVNNETHDLIVNEFKNYKQEGINLDLKKEEFNGSESQFNYTEEEVKIIDKLLDNLYNIYFNSVDKKKSKDYTKDNILILLFPDSKYIIKDDDDEFEKKIDGIKKMLKETEELDNFFKEFEEEEKREEEEYLKWKKKRESDYYDSHDYPYCSSCESSPCMCSDPERTSSLW
jgi:hypothetical protein